MRLAVVLLSLGACTTDSDPDVRVQRQATTVADSLDTAWAEGGAVMAAVPGSFTFPQPLSLRISIVDSKVVDEDGTPTQLAITSADLDAFEAGVAEIVTAPSCDDEFCTAELRVPAAGASMFTVSAVGPEGTQNECFYYAVVEDAAPDAAGAALQTMLESKQQDCRASFFK